MEGNLPKYKMTIGMSVLKPLGANLYTTIPAALSEVVANAWDADAKNVSITVDVGKGEISIVDDGHGMSHEDANSKFLWIGYKRREQGGGTGKSPGGRDVMGRKGIGKLALFSIATIIEVHTMKDGSKSGFSLDEKSIEEASKHQTASNENIEYNPEPILPEDNQMKNDGTTIVLKQLKKQINATATHLRKSISRRFSVLGEDFCISVNGTEVTIADRGYFKNLQYIWTPEVDKNNFKSLASEVTFFGVLPPDTEGNGITGWIGSVKKAGDARDENEKGKESLNKISIVVRGKVAREDILKDMGDAGVYAQYLIGEIHADFLDKEGEEDIATSNRQGFIEDDPRYGKLKDYVREALKTIRKDWSKQRRRESVKSATEHVPDIKERLEALDPETRKKEIRFLEQINSMPFEDKEAKRALEDILSLGEDASKKLASRGIERNEEIYALIEKAGLLNLEQLYSSLSTISLKQHASVGYIIAWVFIENLAVVAKGDKDSTSRTAFSGSGDAIIKYLSNEFDKDGVSHNILKGFNAKSNSIKHENRLSRNALDLRGDFKKLEPMLLKVLKHIQKQQHKH